MCAPRLLCAGFALCAVSAIAPAASLAAPGDVSLLAGGPGRGPAHELALTPTGIAAWDGRLAVSDASGTVRAIDTATGEAELVAGVGASFLAPLGEAAAGRPFTSGYGLAVTPPPARDLLVADACGVVRISRVTNAPVRVVGSCAGDAPAQDGAPATSGRVDAPRAIAADAHGAMLLVDHAGALRRVSPSGILTTLSAPGDPASPIVEGAPLGDAGLYDVAAIALDPATGDLLIAEDQGHRVRRVEANANEAIDGDDPVTTVAGTGVAGFGGDGGPATAAQLNRPAGLSVLADGRVVIGDRLNFRFRVVDGDGTITTVVDGPRSATLAGRPAFEAYLSRPAGSAQIGGRVYLADGFASGIANGSLHQVLELDLATEAVRRVAGNGSAGFFGEDVPGADAQLAGPTAVASAPDGALIVADSGNQRLRRVDEATGRITTVAGTGEACPMPTYCGEGGPATAAALSHPSAVEVAADGTVYWADTSSSSAGTWIARIMKIDPAGVARPVTGPVEDDGEPFEPGSADGPVAAATFSDRIMALELSSDGKRLYVADRGNAKVRMIDLEAGIVSTVAGNGFDEYVPEDEGAPAVDAQLGPSGLAALPDGDLLVSDEPNRRVRRIDAATGHITTVIGTGAAPEEAAQDADGEVLPPAKVPLHAPRALALRSDGAVAIADATRVWLQEPGGPGVRRIHGTHAGPEFAGDAGAALARPLADGYGVAFMADGTLAVTDARAGRVRRVTPPLALMRVQAPAPARVTAGGSAPLELLTGGPLGALELAAGPHVAFTAVRRADGGGDRVLATVSVAAAAAPGARDVVLRAPDGAEAVCAACLLIEPAPDAPAPPGAEPPPRPEAAHPSLARLRVSGSFRRGIRVKLRPSAAGRLNVRLRVSSAAARRLGSRRRVLARRTVRSVGRPVTVVLRPGIRRPRRAVRATIVATLRDRSGREATREARAWLR